MKHAKVNGLVTTGSDGSPDVSNPPISPPSPAIERARLAGKLEGINWARQFNNIDHVEEQMAELQAALDKLDKEQK